MDDQGENYEELQNQHTSMLAVECAHCGFPNKDPWEVLEHGRIDEMRCEACECRFAFALMDCDHCGAEKAFSWSAKPADGAIDSLICESCGRLYRQNDDSSSENESEII